MTILLQDDEGEIAAVIGCSCEQLLCINVLWEDKSIEPELFWLKVQNGLWHRFFIDASFYHMRWQEEADIDRYELEDEEFPVVNIGLQYALSGLQIVKAEMRQTASPRGGQFTLGFADGRSLVFAVNELENTLDLLPVTQPRI